MSQIRAIQALHENYKWQGVWVWLKGRQKCRRCTGTGRISLGVTKGLVGLTASSASFTARACPACGGESKVRGYQRILSEPNEVIKEQTRLAEGVFA